MAATGTEYVTLEQLKDLVTNMIQPLVDAVGSWDKSEHGNVSMAEFCENLTGDYFVSLPYRINDARDGVEIKSSKLFDVLRDGRHGNTYAGLSNVIGSIMLAAPNGDRTQLLGYLGDNTASLTARVPTVRSSAALTYAAESGGSTELPEGTVVAHAVDDGTGLEANQLMKTTNSGNMPIGSIVISDKDMSTTNQKAAVIALSTLTPDNEEGGPTQVMQAVLSMTTMEDNIVNATVASTHASDGENHMYEVVAVDAADNGQNLTADNLKDSKVFTSAYPHQLIALQHP